MTDFTNINQNTGRAKDAQKDKDLRKAFRETHQATKFELDNFEGNYRSTQAKKPGKIVKSRIKCFKCNFHGTANVDEKLSFTKCPKCGTALFNKYATGVKGEKDHNDFSFYAEQPMNFKHG